MIVPPATRCYQMIPEIETLGEFSLRFGSYLKPNDAPVFANFFQLQILLLSHGRLWSIEEIDVRARVLAVTAAYIQLVARRSCQQRWKRQEVVRASRRGLITHHPFCGLLRRD